MQKELKKQVQSVLAAKHTQKRWMKIVSILMAVVVFFTTYSLILPATTLGKKTYCGQEEHTHTEACYSETGDTTELTCGLEEHTHVEQCFEQPESLQFTFTDGDISGVITIPWDESLPDDLSCTVVKVDSEDDDYDAMEESITDTMEKSSKQTVIGSQVYELEWQSQEEKYTLPDSITPTIELTIGTEEDATDDGTDTEEEDDTQYAALIITKDQDLSVDTEENVTTLGEMDGEAESEIESEAEKKAEEKVATACETETEADIETVVGAEEVADIETAEAVEEESVTEEIEVVPDEAVDVTTPDAEAMEQLQTVDDSDVVPEETKLESEIPSDETEVETETTEGSGEDATLETQDTDTYTSTPVTVTSRKATMRMAATSKFAVVQTTTTISGYYERIDSWDELNELESNVSMVDRKFIMVFNNGSRMVTGCYTPGIGLSNAYSSIPVTVSPISGIGNSKYFTVKNSDTQEEISPTSNPEGHYWIYTFPDSIVSYIYQAIDDSSPYSYQMTWYAYMSQTTTDETTGEKTTQSGYYGTIGMYLNSGNSINSWRMYGFIYPSYDYTKYACYYLNCLPDATYTIQTKDASSSYLAQTNFQLYVYQSGDATSTVTAVNDAAAVSALSTDEEENQIATKPTYDADLAVSDAQMETELLTDDDGLGGITMQYASDGSTSNIESIFGMKDSGLTGDELNQAQQKNDGRVVTDKSVIYGKDDYDAIDADDYDSGDYSVTLSALGQEWTVQDVESAETPLDVVFILDLSNSMYSLTDDSDDAVYRWIASIDALNDAMSSILSRNEYNRVGLVTFSNTAEEILPLDRYYAKDDKYIVYDKTYSAHQYYYYTDANGVTKMYDAGEYGTAPKTAPDLTADNAGTEDGKVAQVAMNVAAGMWGCTYTQQGLEMAYNVFANADTTVTIPVTNSNGETVKETTVTRQPVYIMLTDGNPTLGSINYTDPLSGPNVGEGAEYGVLGYYTVLSANYFKNQVSLHYNQKAYFYTIGMGIMSSGHGTYDEKKAVDAGDSLANVSSLTSYVDDAYRRAVLNPTADNIEELDSWSELSKDFEDAYVYVLQEWKNTSSQFKELITNQADLSSVYQVARDEMNYLTGLGWTCQYLYGISNPYYDMKAEDYGINYVDNAYFGNLSEEDMEYIFSSIISKLQVVNNYNFFLEEESSVTITDPIGTGMEVKGEPVLRYYGVNYPATSTKSGTDKDGNAYIEYKWNYVVDREYSDTKWLEEEQTVDLNGITARVTTMTDSSGGTYEVVKFDISEDAMAVYYPDLYKTFYYEELPVRLIYRVGLQASVLDALKDTIGEITPQVYYTNSYDADSGMIATTTFTPTKDNTYYSATRKNTTAKTSAANVTDTYDNSFKEWVDADTRQVTQTLGNNGKLTISRPDSLTLTVKKEWSDDTTPADSVSINLYAVGTRVKDGSETSEQGVWLVDTIVLGDSNNWKYQWKRYPKTAQIDGYTYTYTSFFINESPSEQYAATYKNDDGAVLTVTELEQTDQTTSTDDDLESIRAVAAENGGTIYIINSQLYQLPETGGIGTYWYTLGGTTILLAVFALYIYGRHKRSRLNVER